MFKLITYLPTLNIIYKCNTLLSKYISLSITATFILILCKSLNSIFWELFHQVNLKPFIKLTKKQIDDWLNGENLTKNFLSSEKILHFHCEVYVIIFDKLSIRKMKLGIIKFKFYYQVSLLSFKFYAELKLLNNNKSILIF